MQAMINTSVPAGAWKCILGNYELIKQYMINIGIYIDIE